MASPVADQIPGRPLRLDRSQRCGGRLRTVDGAFSPWRPCGVVGGGRVRLGRWRERPKSAGAGASFQEDTAASRRRGGWRGKVDCVGRERVVEAPRGGMARRLSALEAAMRGRGGGALILLRRTVDGASSPRRSCGVAGEGGSIGTMGGAAESTEVGASFLGVSAASRWRGRRWGEEDCVRRVRRMVDRASSPRRRRGGGGFDQDDRGSGRGALRWGRCFGGFPPHCDAILIW